MNLKISQLQVGKLYKVFSKKQDKVPSNINQVLLVVADKEDGNVTQNNWISSGSIVMLLEKYPNMDMMEVLYVDTIKKNNINGFIFTNHTLVESI